MTSNWLKVARWLGYPLSRIVKGVINIMYYVLKNFLLIVIAFLAPIWFPLTQRVFNNEILSYIEWLKLILILCIPLLIMWWGDKKERTERENKLGDVINGAINSNLQVRHDALVASINTLAEEIRKDREVRTR